MLDAAMDAGAYGGKINGSGGGGCMFAYAPKDPEVVAEAIKRVEAKHISFMLMKERGSPQFNYLNHRSEEKGILATVFILQKKM